MVELFKSNRDRLISKIPDNTVALFFAGEPASMSQDDDYSFLVDRNFYYLTGLTLPGLILRIVKKYGKASVNLFAFPHDDYQERWHGKRPDFEELSEKTGIAVSDIVDIDNFVEDTRTLVKDPALKVAFDGSSIMKDPRHYREQAAALRTDDDIIDIKDIMTSLRLVKSDEEADLIREAARITEESIEAMKEDIRPGVTEYELHTRLEY